MCATTALNLKSISLITKSLKSRVAVAPNVHDYDDTVHLRCDRYAG